MVYAVIDFAVVLIHVVIIWFNVGLWQKNTVNWLKYQDKVFLRLRKYSVGAIIWSTFAGAGSTIFALHALHILLY